MEVHSRSLGRRARSYGRTGGLRQPIDALARLFSEVDTALGCDGIASAFGALLARYARDPRISGAKNSLAAGTLVLASNHPGAYDALLIC